jgi:hypothetical protein
LLFINNLTGSQDELFSAHSGPEVKSPDASSLSAVQNDSKLITEIMEHNSKLLNKVLEKGNLGEGAA